MFQLALRRLTMDIREDQLSMQVCVTHYLAHRKRQERLRYMSGPDADEEREQRYSALMAWAKKGSGYSRRLAINRQVLLHVSTQFGDVEVYDEPRVTTQAGR